MHHVMCQNVLGELHLLDITHLAGVIILRKRSATVHVSLWSGSIECSNRAKALPTGSLTIKKYWDMVICICTCVGWMFALMTVV